MAKGLLPVWQLKNSMQAQLLRMVAKPVDVAMIQTASFQRLIDQMIATMYHVDGIGLAAPQIGQSIRLAVIAREIPDGPTCLVLINPVISNVSSQQESLEEGCLSIPKVFGPVPRAVAVKLTAIDRHGQPYSLSAKDLFARVIQHEVDHLNGKLFIDRVTEITEGKHLL